MLSLRHWQLLRMGDVLWSECSMQLMSTCSVTPDCSNAVCFTELSSLAKNGSSTASLGGRRAS